MSWKKDEDGGELGALMTVDQSAVLQEARIFNETPLKPRQCRLLLAKLMYILQRGDVLSTTEATELFFNITKLFQNKDMSLRQMVYLAIKELSEISEDVIMVTSSLMKDIQPKSEEMYRAKAIRALCKITDVSMLPAIERFLKGAIVDKNQVISSAALVSAYHLQWKAREIVRRWGGEVQEALSHSGGSGSFFGGSSGAATTGSGIEQYHALGLQYMLKQQDRMAVAKMVQGLSGIGGGRSGGWFGGGGGGGAVLKNGMAQVLMVRYAVKVMGDDTGMQQGLEDLLEDNLRSRTDMVSLEAARAICEYEGVSKKRLSAAVSVLQGFLGSNKTVLRFAAMRILDRLASRRADAAQVCNVDIEGLISDSSRPVATLAITTLLKTGNEASVDRLMGQMQSFMAEISDEFRTIVAEAVKNLSVKFPQKHAVFLSFLAGALRDEGSLEFKQRIVDSIIGLARQVGECRETALAHLCEFIEDCEFSKLSVQVLHFLGQEGPATSQPTIYIRHIYNRVILEDAVVRAAAVSSLAKFGAAPQAEGKLRTSIQTLLKRCLDDRDDEVRDRAVWALSLMRDERKRVRYIRDDSTFALDQLEANLAAHAFDPAYASKRIDLSAIPRVSRDAELAARTHIGLLSSPSIPMSREQSLQLADSRTSTPMISTTTTAGATTTTAAVGAGAGAVYSAEAKEKAEQTAQMFSEFGPVLSSSTSPTALTESETEYTVACYKHVFARHIVFQFDCVNTLNECILEHVYVDMTTDDDIDSVLRPLNAVPIDSLSYNSPKSTYVAFELLLPDSLLDGSCPIASFDCLLKFKVVDCDPSTLEKLDPEDPGFDDEYLLESVDLAEADYCCPDYFSDWNALFDSYPESLQSFALPHLHTINACVQNLIDLLGLYSLDLASNSLPLPDSLKAHQSYFMGSFMRGSKVIVRARMTLDPQSTNGVTLELSVRSEDPLLSQFIIGSIA